MARSADQWQQLETYFAAVLDSLNLSHWVVNILREGAEDDAWADISPHSQAFQADLRVSEHLWIEPRERIRGVLVHEALHLAMAHQDDLVEGLSASLGKVAWSVFEPAYDAASERTVEAIANAVAPYLPLPPFGKA